MAFEVLDIAFVLFGFFEGVEGAEITALSRGGVFFAGIQAEFSGF